MKRRAAEKGHEEASVHAWGVVGPLRKPWSLVLAGPCRDVPPVASSAKSEQARIVLLLFLRKTEKHMLVVVPQEDGETRVTLFKIQCQIVLDACHTAQSLAPSRQRGTRRTVDVFPLAWNRCYSLSRPIRHRSMLLVSNADTHRAHLRAGHTEAIARQIRRN